MKAKKLLSIVLSVAMLISCLSVVTLSASAAQPEYSLVGSTDFEDGSTWGFTSTDTKVAPVTVITTTEAGAEVQNHALEWAINRSRSTSNGGMYNVAKTFNPPIVGQQVKVEFDWRPGQADYVKREGLVHVSQVSLIDEDRNVIFSVNNNIINDKYHDKYLSYTVGEGGTSNGSERHMLPFSDVWAWYHVSIEVDFANDCVNLVMYDQAKPADVCTINGISLDKSNHLGNLGHIDLRMIRPGGDCMILDSMLIDNMSVSKTAAADSTAISLPDEYDFTTVYVGAAPKLADVGLPTQVSAKTAAGATVSVPVTAWSCPDYDNSKAGMYLATATLGTASGVTLDRNLTAHMWIYVRNTVETRNSVARLVEYLDRGVVALKSNDGIFVSWRLLASEYKTNIAFNVYRNGVKVNDAPITTKTNLVDAAGAAGDKYVVETILNGVSTMSEEATAVGTNYLNVPIQVPANTKTLSGGNITYSANDIMTSDLDGDGEYEIIVRWMPSSNVDSGSNGKLTGATIFEAYKLDGTILWQINIGLNMTSGEHYNEITCQDYNGDGRGEVALLTVDGTTVYGVDTENNKIDYNKVLTVIGDPTADWIIRNNSVKNNSANRVGHMNENGKIFFTMFDGTTGAAIDTVDFYAQTVDAGFWGDLDYNRSDRYKATSAFIRDSANATTGHIAALMGRGYYERTVVAAYSLDKNDKIRLDWVHDTWYYDEKEQTWKKADGNNYAECRGAHSTSVADVDNDGFDEFIGGAYCLDDDGTTLWNSDGLYGRPNLAHGDALHVGAFLPGDGIQLMMPHEEVQDRTNSVSFLDAATGECLSGYDTNTGDVGRGCCGNIDANPGFEYWASGYAVYSCVDGSVAYASQGGMSVNFVVYWDGDLLTENLNGTTVSKDVGSNGSINRSTILSMSGTTAGNGSKSVPGLTADILGDWREEILMRTSDNKAVRIYSTTTPTDYMIYTLMHDGAYRMQCAGQMAAYNQPNHLSFYLGEDVKDDILAMNLVKPNTYAVQYGVEPQADVIYDVEVSPAYVQPDEAFTVTVTTDASVKLVNLYNENGSGLVTQKGMVENNGKKVWTLTTALSTKGERQLSVVATLEDDTTVTAEAPAVVNIGLGYAPSGDADAAISSILPGAVNVTVNTPAVYTVKTNGAVERLAFFSETGTGLYTTNVLESEENGVRTWTITVTLGTIGERNLTLKTMTNGAWSDDGAQVSFFVTK